jgi:hypothetical protein
MVAGIGNRPRALPHVKGMRANPGVSNEIFSNKTLTPTPVPDHDVTTGTFSNDEGQI